MSDENRKSRLDEPGEPVEVKVVDRRWWARDTEAGEGPGGMRKPTYVEDLERRLAEKTEQLQAAVAQHRQAVEEFDQVRARMRRDVARDVALGRRQILVELLDVLDNLDRALAAAREAADGGPLRQGVAMVRDQFLAKLEGFGVRRLPALGEPFDPSRHEAVSTLPADHAEDEGRIVGVVKEGYTIGEELLRPAQVVVARQVEAAG